MLSDTAKSHAALCQLAAHGFTFSVRSEGELMQARTNNIDKVVNACLDVEEGVVRVWQDTGEEKPERVGFIYFVTDCTGLVFVDCSASLPI